MCLYIFSRDTYSESVGHTSSDDSIPSAIMSHFFLCKCIEDGERYIRIRLYTKINHILIVEILTIYKKRSTLFIRIIK